MNFNLTDAAKKQILQLNTSGKITNGVFRVQVKAGGCSGFEYVFQLDSQIEDSDFVVELGGVKCAIDDASITLISDSTLDYEMDLSGEKFVVKNPNATAKCGCGNSFAL